MTFHGTLTDERIVVIEQVGSLQHSVQLQLRFVARLRSYGHCGRRAGVRAEGTRGGGDGGGVCMGWGGGGRRVYGEGVGG